MDVRQHGALRAALGASAPRILQYLAIENGLLVAAGGLLGVIAARAGLPALLALQPTSLSPFRHISIDGAVLGFALLLAVVVTAAITGFTAWRLRYGSLTGRLADGGKGTGVARGSLRVQRALVVAQIAASLLLLVGSSLLIRSFTGLQRVDAGFDPNPVVAIRVVAPPPPPPARSPPHRPPRAASPD